MRIGIKMVEMILCTGIDNLPTKVAQKAFADEVEILVNTKIFPNELEAWHWHFPLAEKKKDGDQPGKLVVGDVRLTNPRLRYFTNQLELLIGKCLEHREHKKCLKRVIKHYRSGLNFLRKKTDYTDDEIEQFQDDMDLSFQDWVFVFGRSGITNYWHFLQSGHVLEYIKKHRCL
jgi:hypothetical protein